MATYSIKDLERLSGIQAHTIRIWEKRYQLLVPERSNTNIRHYTDEDLRKLLNVAFLIKNGRKISRIALLSEETMKYEILRLENQHVEADHKIDQLIRLMVNLDTSKFEKTVEHIFAEMGVETAVSDIIFPLLQKIGVLWHTGSIFPAHEHFVSGIIRNKLITESSKLGGPTSEKTILFFLKEGEQHELSLLYYHFLAKKMGLQTIYLGASVPFNDLKQLEKKFHFDNVMTIFINPIGKEELEDYLNQISMLFADKTICITGAQLYKKMPQLPVGIKTVTNKDDFSRYIKDSLS